MMSGVKVDFRMFPGFDLQIVSLKRPIKKDTSSFNMRATYPKIPRLSVKAYAPIEQTSDGGSVTERDFHCANFNLRW
jgi:hypothetical protein